MSTPTPYRPGRILLFFGLVTLILAAWAMWPGQDHTPKLGLDLRGGTQVVFTPRVAEGSDMVISQNDIDRTVEIMRQRVNGSGIAEAEVTTEGSGSGASVIVSIPSSADPAVLDTLKQSASMEFRPVLQEAVGIPFDAGELSGLDDEDLDFLPEDIDPEEVEEPSLSEQIFGTQGMDMEPMAARTAAETDPATAPDDSEEVTTTDKEFDEASETEGAEEIEPISADDDSAVVTDAVLPPIQAKELTEELQQGFAQLNCQAPGALAGGAFIEQDEYLATCSQDGTAKYLLGPTEVPGTDVNSATAAISQQGIGWEVQLEFSADGADAFRETTQKLFGQPAPTNQFGIVLDGLVLTAPAVQAVIPNGQAQITGNFTAESAQALANNLSFGALPITLDQLGMETISPTLGQDQLTAGLIAGAIGLGLVVIFLLAYYRALGSVAVLSLVFAGAITYFTMVIMSRTMGFTLTLAGITGAIVAVGITADTFVIYFERIRDEAREGRRLSAAMDAGWMRARRTLIAADFVTLLSALVLYFLSVGGVRGFAFVLGLTTVIDLFIAFMFTRPFVFVLGQTKWFSSGKRLTGLDAATLGVNRERVIATKVSVPAAATTSEKGH